MPKSGAARTVNQLNADEQRTRQGLAAASSSRRASENESLRQSQADANRRHDATASRTDSSIQDEVAGRKRIELAAIDFSPGSKHAPIQLYEPGLGVKDVTPRPRA